MEKVRIGNDIQVKYTVLRDGLPESFAGATNIVVEVRNEAYGKIIPSTFSIVDNVVNVVLDAKDCVLCGKHRVTLSYNRGNDITIDALAFELVQFTSLTGGTEIVGVEIVTVNISGDIGIAIPDNNKIDLNGLNSDIQRLQFDTVNPVAGTQAGQVYWSDEEKTLVLNDGYHTHPIGKELGPLVKNNSGQTILNGQACYVIGSTGDNPTIGLASTANGDVAQKTIGVATMDIEANGFGIVTTFGEVNDIDTSALTLGAIVYLGANGTLTTTEPVAPTPKIVIGICVRQHAHVGKLFVSTRPIARLSKLSEVHAPTLTDNDVLRWNGTTLRWEVYSLANKADLVGGKVPTSQLPSYVDDVLEYANLAAFPATGETGKIYVALDTNLTYRWSGTAYVEISKSLALGETSSTAYRGDRGKTAYDHSQASGNPHGTTASQIPNTPAGTIAATTVQGAINELAGDIAQVETDLNKKSGINGEWNPFTPSAFFDVNSIAPDTSFVFKAIRGVYLYNISWLPTSDLYIRWMWRTSDGRLQFVIWNKSSNLLNFKTEILSSKTGLYLVKVTNGNYPICILLDVDAFNIVQPTTGNEGNDIKLNILKLKKSSFQYVNNANILVDKLQEYKCNFNGSFNSLPLDEVFQVDGIVSNITALNSISAIGLYDSSWNIASTPNPSDSFLCLQYCYKNSQNKFVAIITNGTTNRLIISYDMTGLNGLIEIKSSNLFYPFIFVVDTSKFNLVEVTGGVSMGLSLKIDVNKLIRTPYNIVLEKTQKLQFNIDYPLSDKKILAIGDSITFGVGSGGTGGYPEVLANISGATVYNAGIGGTRLTNIQITSTPAEVYLSQLNAVKMAEAIATGYWNDIIDAATALDAIDHTAKAMISVNRVKNLLIKDIDMVIISSGTNDLNKSTTGVKTSIDDSTIYGAINKISSHILSAKKSMKILICQPIVRWFDYSTQHGNIAYWSDNYESPEIPGRTLATLSNDISDAAKWQHLNVANLYWELGWNTNNYSIFTADGTHPNQTGYLILGELVYKFVKNVFCN